MIILRNKQFGPDRFRNPNDYDLRTGQKLTPKEQFERRLRELSSRQQRPQSPSPKQLISSGITPGTNRAFLKTPSLSQRARNMAKNVVKRY